MVDIWIFLTRVLWKWAIHVVTICIVMHMVMKLEYYESYTIFAIHMVMKLEYSNTYGNETRVLWKWAIHVVTICIAHFHSTLVSLSIFLDIRVEDTSNLGGGWRSRTEWSLNPPGTRTLHCRNSKKLLRMCALMEESMLLTTMRTTSRSLRWGKRSLSLKDW